MRREVAVPDKNAEAQVKHVTLADPSDKSQAGASIPGMVSKISRQARRRGGGEPGAGRH